MVSFADIQNAYNKMYAQIRKYVWDFPTVAALADLEIAVYKTCQDLADVKTKFYRLRSCIADVIQIDEDLSKVVDTFENLVHEQDTFVKLNQVEEVIQV